jgi:hypothetical protein
MSRDDMFDYFTARGSAGVCRVVICLNTLMEEVRVGYVA